MNRFGLPNLGIGVGLRTVHYQHILEHAPAVDWFEILSDNYMHTAGRPLLFADAIAARYPVAMHGVGLSIGSTDPLDVLGGHLKSGHSWTGQNRPPGQRSETGEVYFCASSGRKSVCTLVRQLLGPHLRTWA